MLAGKRIKSLNQLVSIAAKTAGMVIPSGCSHAFPIPVKFPPAIRTISFLYRASFDILMPGHRKARIVVYPPHKILVQDPYTGKVTRFADCSPRDFGIDHPLQTPLLKSVINFAPDGEDLFTRHKQLFMKLSPKVWEIYSLAEMTYPDRWVKMIREYKLLLEEVIPKPLIPFYRAASPDFFEWLERSAS